MEFAVQGVVLRWKTSWSEVQELPLDILDKHILHITIST